MPENIGFRIDVDSTGLDAAARRLQDVNSQAKQINQQGATGPDYLSSYFGGQKGVPGGPDAQKLADAQALRDSRMAEAANRRLLEEKRTDVAQSAERQSLWAAGITRLANPADRALQRYQEEQERLKAQGTQVTPGQLQHLNATRIHAQSEFAKFSGLVGHPDEVAQRMGLHGFAEPVGKAETGALDKLVGSEADKRKTLLGILDKETDVRRRSYEDEQNRPKGGGVGAAAAGAASFGGALLGAAGISLSIAGIMSLLGLDSLFQGPAVWDARERFSGRMGGFNLSGGRTIGAGYRYGYTQDQSMPFGEAWAAQSGEEPGQAQFRLARAYNIPFSSELQFGKLAGQAGTTETTRLLMRIASNITDLNVPIGRIGELFKDYGQVVAMGLQTQGIVDPRGIGDVMGYLGHILGGQYAGQTAGTFSAINSGITNPAGSPQSFLNMRAFGAYDGGMQGYNRALIMGKAGAFGLSDATTQRLEEAGTIPKDSNMTGIHSVELILGALSKYPKLMQQGAVMAEFPSMSVDASSSIVTEIRTGNAGITAASQDVEAELKAEAQKEEERANRLPSAVERVAVKQEAGAVLVASAYMPLLTQIRDAVADAVTLIAPGAASNFVKNSVEMLKFFGGGQVVSMNKAIAGAAQKLSKGWRERDPGLSKFLGDVDTSPLDASFPAVEANYTSPYADDYLDEAGYKGRKGPDYRRVEAEIQRALTSELARQNMESRFQDAVNRSSAGYSGYERGGGFTAAAQSTLDKIEANTAEVKKHAATTADAVTKKQPGNTIPSFMGFVGWGTP